MGHAVMVTAAWSNRTCSLAIPTFLGPRAHRERSPPAPGQSAADAKRRRNRSGLALELASTWSFSRLLMGDLAQT